MPLRFSRPGWRAVSRGPFDRRACDCSSQTAARKLETGRVVSDRGVVHAETVLLAAEAYVSKLAGFERQLAPIHSRMVATAPLSASQRDELGLSRSGSFAMAGDGYGQLTADGRIAFGARGTYYFGSRIKDRFDSDSRDTQRVWKLLLEYFPSLEGVPMTHSWGGAMGFARDERPFVFLDAKKQLGWAGGHGPAGVAPSCMAGETLAELVLGPGDAARRRALGRRRVAAALGARAAPLARNQRRQGVAGPLSRDTRTVRVGEKRWSGA